MKLNHSFRTAAKDGGTPAPGRWIAAEPGDRARWLQTSEDTPVNVSRILEAANEGDIAELAVAAREIQERNWEVIQHTTRLHQDGLTIGLDIYLLHFTTTFLPLIIYKPDLRFEV